MADVSYQTILVMDHAAPSWVDQVFWTTTDGNKLWWTAMADAFIPRCSVDHFLMAVRTSWQTDKDTDY